MFQKKNSLIIFSFIILLLFFIFKIKRFNDFNYSFDDLFGFLQMATTWIDHRPILTENVSGNNGLNHNHYGILLWSILAYFWGAYGLFFGQFYLIGLSYFILWKYELKFFNKNFQFIFGAIFLFGATWIWLNDHPFVGWSIELGYLPMGILFTVFYFNKKNIAFLISIVYILLIKEDGAIIGFCFHIICFGVSQFSTQKTFKQLLFNKKTWLITMAWLSAFIIGILFINYKNKLVARETQLNKILNNLQLSTILEYQGLVLFKLLILIIPLIIFIGYLIQVSKNQEKRNYWILLILVLVLNIAVISLQGLLYVQKGYENFEFTGLLYPPRVMQVYAILTVFCLAVFISSDKFQFFKKLNLKTYLLVSFIFISQFYTTSYAVNFNFYSVVKNLIKSDSYIKQQQWAYSSSDIKYMQELASKLPEKTDVFVMDFFIPIFHKHFIVWPSNHHYKEPGIAIFPKKDIQNLEKFLHQNMKQSYKKKSLDLINVYYTKEFEDFVNYSK